MAETATIGEKTALEAQQGLGSTRVPGTITVFMSLVLQLSVSTFNWQGSVSLEGILCGLISKFSLNMKASAPHAVMKRD